MKRMLMLVTSLTLVATSVPAPAQPVAPYTPPPSGGPPRDGSPWDAPVDVARPEAAPVGEAGAPDDLQVRQARGHFGRGVQLYREADYDGALAEFTRCYQLAPNYRILYNLGQTQAQRHDYVEAFNLLGEYLAQGGGEITAARRQGTEQDRSVLAERIATVDIRSNVVDAELFVDGRSRGVVAGTRSVAFNPGPIDLRLEKPGHAAASHQVTLAGGDVLTLVFRLEPTSSAQLVPARPVTPGLAESSASRTGMWLSVAATSVLAGATVSFAVLTANANRDLDDSLRELQSDPSGRDPMRAKVKTLAAFTDAFGVATALSAGAVVYFLLSDPVSSSSGSRSGAGLGLSRTHLELTGSGVRVVGGF
jgi:hypothetical protein